MLRALWRHLLCCDADAEARGGDGDGDSDSDAPPADVARLLVRPRSESSAEDASWCLRCELAAPVIAYAFVCRRLYKSRVEARAAAAASLSPPLSQTATWADTQLRIGELVRAAAAAGEGGADSSLGAQAQTREGADADSGTHPLLLALFSVCCALREPDSDAATRLGAAQQYGAIAAIGPTNDLFVILVRNAPRAFAGALRLGARRSGHPLRPGATLTRLWEYALMELGEGEWRAVFAAAGEGAAGGHAAAVLFETVAGQFINAAPGVRDIPHCESGENESGEDESNGWGAAACGALLAQRLALLRTGLVVCIEALPAAAFHGAGGWRGGGASAAAAEIPLPLLRLERCAPDADALFRTRMRREVVASNGSGGGAEAAAAARTRPAGESENARSRSVPKERAAAATRDALRETQPHGVNVSQKRRYSRLSLSRSR